MARSPGALLLRGRSSGALNPFGTLHTKFIAICVTRPAILLVLAMSKSSCVAKEKERWHTNVMRDGYVDPMQGFMKQDNRKRFTLGGGCGHNGPMYSKHVDIKFLPPLSASHSRKPNERGCIHSKVKLQIVRCSVLFVVFDSYSCRRLAF